MARPADLDSLGAEIARLGRSCAETQADIRDRDAIRGGPRAASRSVAPPGIVGAGAGAGAGITGDQPFLHTPDAEWASAWDLIADVDVKGAADTIRAAAPTLGANGGGAIVVTWSTFGRQGNATNPACVASKGALTGLVEAATIGFGPAGITVNAVAPTAVRAGLSGPQTEKQRARSDEWLDADYHARDVGLREPADIAPTAVYLASPAAPHVTGATVAVAAGTDARCTA